MHGRQGSSSRHSIAYLMVTATLLLCVLPSFTVAQTASPPLTYLPQAGRDDPELLATARRLLAARGIGGKATPIVRLVLVEPQWQSERAPGRGNVSRRTINAAVVYRGEGAGHPLLLRYALLAADSRGRQSAGNYGPIYLRDLGVPRPVAPSALNPVKAPR